ncbi:MAG TPA: hypothetical protein VGF48_11795 [Thermoanaerobaculia bacterium]
MKSLLLALLLAAHAADVTADCRHLLFATGDDGRPSAGSKETLQRAVAAGTPIRVWWGIDADRDGKHDVTHWADAVFLTEFEGELFTQITEIRRQSPKAGTAHVNLHPEPVRWTGSVGTNGTLEGAFDPALGEPRQMKLATKWCANVPPDCSSGWRLAYEHDRDGKALGGSKEQLFAAVRRGYPIRIAWGMRTNDGKISVEHASDTVFVTIMNGAEVVAQLPEHASQTSYWNAQEANFDAAGVLWRGMMSTTGGFDAVFVNRGSGEVTKRLPQRARMRWMVLAPPAECETTAAPELAVTGGVIVEK